MPRVQCVYRRATSNGYIVLRVPHHPRADRNGWVLEHVIVAELMNGGPLPAGAVVHHVNGIRSDNRPENLHVFTSQSEHSRIHALARRLGAQRELWLDRVLLGWPLGLPSLPPPWRG